MSSRKQHLSMLRSYTQADLFTLGNASCGTISIFLCLNYTAEGRSQYFWIAFLLLFAALGCDIMDGYWSRKSGRQSILGADLDSLADIVSFGVAPAVLGYTLGLRGLWDTVFLTYFVCCGISRLARFNVTAMALTNTSTGKVKYFEGLPIPTSVFLVLLMALLFWLDLTGAHPGTHFWGGHYKLIGRDFHPFSVLFAISGSLVI